MMSAKKKAGKTARTLDAACALTDTQQDTSLTPSCNGNALQ